MSIHDTQFHLYHRKNNNHMVQMAEAVMVEHTVDLMVEVLMVMALMVMALMMDIGVMVLWIISILLK